MMLISVANTPNIIQEPSSQQVEAKEIQSGGKLTIKATSATTTLIVPEPVVVIDITTATTSADIKRITKEYFKNTPVLAEIARCESTYRQFSPTGVVLRGRVNGADVGVMQINEKYHLYRSKQLGLDIHTLEGNLKYGALLYKEQGSQPWSASRPCWGKV